MSNAPPSARGESNGRILPLSADAIAQVQSSKQITSLQGVILALLENSLDAGASKVHVDVSFSRGSCTIEDNGAGIPIHEFFEHGGLGKLHHTSKLPSGNGRDLHGSTGTYLASLAALSLLSITSRHAGQDESATLTMHQGRVVARHVPSLPSSELTTYEHGTRATVNDLFGNMPVRVKQRAMSAETTTGVNDKTWQQVKHGIAALLLFWRAPCSVKLRDVDNTERLLTLAASHPAVSAALTEKNLNELSGKTARFDLRDALPVVFQAGFAAFDTRSRWVPVSASTLKLSIRGLICLDPAPTRSCQFVGLGTQSCSTAQGHSAIYESVNRLFVDSSFGSVEEDVRPDEAEEYRRKHDRRFKSDGYTQRQTRGGKGVDRWPMYVIQVKVRSPGAQREVSEYASDNQLKDITDVLEAMITQWLAAHNFRPRKKRRRDNGNELSPVISASSPSRIATAKVSSGVDTPFSGLRQVSAAGSDASLGKRRRVGGSAVVNDHLGNDTAVAAARRFHSADLDTWSRIKSGRRVLLSDQLEGRKVIPSSVTAPGRVLDRADGDVAHATPQSATPRLSFREHDGCVAGEQKPDPNVPSMNLGTEQPDARISSDCFGSIDEEDILAAAGDGYNEGKRAGSVSDAQHIGVTIDEATTDWTDPVTRQVFRVNTRTGVVLPADPHRPKTANPVTPSRRSAAINTATTSAGRPLTLARRAVITPDQRADHVLPPFIKDWQNPIFLHKTEDEIPVASISGPGMLLDDESSKRCNHHALTDHFATSAVNGQGKISKESLRSAEVIRQVDAKFILCCMTSASAPAVKRLVLVDQHAASERVLLEQLFAELCTPLDPTLAPIRTNLGHRSSVLTTTSAEPLHLEVTREEYELFRSHAAHFAHWGVLYDVRNDADTVTASQVRPARQRFKLIVRYLPPGIAERCRLFPKILVALLRSEIWSLASSGPRNAAVNNHSRPCGDTAAWLQRLGSCPKGIIDMLNSRACRSAIMFNDVLSVEQCQAMLKELSDCVFPFMCAHGRVSMVPLVQLGGEGDGLGVGMDVLKQSADERKEATFTNMFGRWQRGRRDADTVNEDV